MTLPQMNTQKSIENRVYIERSQICMTELQSYLL